jgi:hypothetical protein
MEQQFHELSVSSGVSGEWDDETEEYDPLIAPDRNLYSRVLQQCFTLDSKMITSSAESFEDFLTKVEANSHPRSRRDVCLTVSFEVAAPQLQFSTEITHSRLGQLAVGPSGLVDISGGISQGQGKVALEAALDEIASFMASSEPIISGGLNDHSEP